MFIKNKQINLKIYGVYGLNITGKHQQTTKIHVLVMEYLFYGKNIKQIWDLKGSLRNRFFILYFIFKIILTDKFFFYYIKNCKFKKKIIKDMLQQKKNHKFYLMKI